METFARQVAGLGLEFLQADEVGVLPLQPVEEALAGGRTDAVQVQGYDTQHSQYPDGNDGL